MSGIYAYVLCDNGQPILGGSNKYHVTNWWLYDERYPERQRDFQLGRYKILRLTPDSCVDITDEILKELQK